MVLVVPERIYTQLYTRRNRVLLRFRMPFSVNINYHKHHPSFNLMLVPAVRRVFRTCLTTL